MTKIHPLKFPADNDSVLSGQLTLPKANAKACPTVILVPALLSECQEKLHSAVTKSLLARGIAVVEYQSETVLGSHRDNARPTLSQRSRELSWVMTGLFERMFEPGDAVDIRKLGVYGHAFGASVALHRAAEDTRIRSLALSSPMLKPHHGFQDTVKEDWEAGRESEIQTADGRRVRLSRAFELDWIRGGRDLASEAEALKVPVNLFSGVNGREDLVGAARRIFFRQPQHGRLKNFQANEDFSGVEERFGESVAECFGQQWGRQVEAKVQPNHYSGGESFGIPTVL